jgi:hypothetical protein
MLGREVHVVTADAGEIDRVFILRFWRETASEETNEIRWRARIRFVNTNRQIHADGVDAAFKIVRSMLIDDEYEPR